MSTIRLRFEPSGFEVDAESGEAIMDITDANPEAGIPYSCRAANCGTCRARVVEGGQTLLPADEVELELLGLFGDSPDDVRLCCQARLRDGGGARVVLAVCED